MNIKLDVKAVVILINYGIILRGKRSVKEVMEAESKQERQTCRNTKQIEREK